MENNNSKRKILDAALKEFAEKGFEGSRVEKIAQRAGVSKALIYYNFDSKESILEELMKEFQKDLVQHLANTYETCQKETKWKKLESDEIQASMDFILQNHLQYRILVMESLKSPRGKNKFLTLWDEVNQEVRIGILANRGYHIDMTDVQRHLVDFFFINIPTVMFSILGTDWATQNGYPIQEVREKLGGLLTNLYDTHLS